MTSPEWGRLAQPLWEAVANALGVKRLAMQAPVADTGDMACMHAVAGCSVRTHHSKVCLAMDMLQTSHQFHDCQ